MAKRCIPERLATQAFPPPDRPRSILVEARAEAAHRAHVGKEAPFLLPSGVMRTRALILVAALATASGWYQEQKATFTSASEELGLEQALAAGRSGQQGPWTLAHGLYAVSLAGGGVRVTRGANGASGIPVHGASNAWITAKVRSKFAADPDTKAFDIHVDTDENGVVTLRGNVQGPHMATKAVEDALNTDGVNAVDSYLTW
jgi:hyperosmotically inducible protein